MLTRALLVAALLTVLAACGGSEEPEVVKATAALGSVALEPTDSDVVPIDDDSKPSTTAGRKAAADRGSRSDGEGEASTSGDAPLPSTKSIATGSEEPIRIDDQSVAINWAALPATPYFAPADDGDDPFFHIHTHPESDGFFLAFEMFTVWGEGWAGELGTVDIGCLNPKTGSGICAYFDPDGVGPKPTLGDDFGATGSMTIGRLDDTGYEIVVHELTFTDGTTFEEFSMTG